uniref:MIT domain-containing protein n=1 Tax=Ganoderma boninense TaxID=34458 RepID=A0A5K1K4K5_9APHY|nr:MIT domain-containing protein [Ganoderma boninense]
MKRAGHVLDASLPYESRPTAERRIRFTADANGVEVSSADDALAIIAHAAHDRSGRHKVTYSMGFAVAPPGLPEEQIALLTCAHTLEEVSNCMGAPAAGDGIFPSCSRVVALVWPLRPFLSLLLKQHTKIRHDPLVRANRPSPAVSSDTLRSGSLAISRSSSSSTATPVFRPISSVLSAMHRGDLLLLSAMQSRLASGPASSSGLRSLPVNPYPVPPGTPIRAHFVADKPPTGTNRERWTPWPGTYDSLAHLHFDPPPTPGSSGGPIVDEESGSVIGVVLGTQLVNQVEGVKGWGVPAEMIFEVRPSSMDLVSYIDMQAFAPPSEQMFSLPGLKLNNRA